MVGVVSGGACPLLCLGPASGTSTKIDPTSARLSPARLLLENGSSRNPVKGFLLVCFSAHTLCSPGISCQGLSNDAVIYCDSKREGTVPRGPRSIEPADEKAIGARLKELRERRHFNQLKLAEALGVNQSLLSRYERGALRLHGAILAKAARTLKVSADQLLGLQEIKGNGLRKHHPQFVQRLEKIDRLSKRDKQALLRNIDNFLKGAGVA